MRKKLFALASLIALLCIFVVGSTPVSAIGSVNDFEIQDYQIDYYLGRGSDGRSI